MSSSPWASSLSEAEEVERTPCLAVVGALAPLAAVESEVQAVRDEMALRSAGSRASGFATCRGMILMLLSYCERLSPHCKEGGQSNRKYV